MNLTVGQAAAAMGALGDVDSEQDVRLTGVCTDSRVVGPGQLFFCLAGDNFDAHAFVEDVASRGAAGVVVSRPVPEVDGRLPVLMVRDVQEALGRLAAHWRAATGAEVVAVTGSAGKTTAKEMLAAILDRLGETARNAGNLNNLIGVPLTMLACSGEERFWVLELGISLPGEMDELGAMVRPDVAVVNNIAPAHLEGLGSLRGVAEAKSSLFKYLMPGGRAFASGDYDLLTEQVRDVAPGARLFSTRDAAAELYAAYLGPVGGGLGRYRLVLDGEEAAFDAPFTGAAFAENMVAAASVAHALGAGMDDIVAGIAGARVPGGRFEVRSAGRWTLIDDSYNANPLSMRQAVDNAAELANGQPLVLVLGDMRELGCEAAALHRELGRSVAGRAPAAIFFHGEHGGDVAAGLEDGGFSGVFGRVSDPAGFPDDFRELGLSGGTILFKGSRGCRMERYVRAVAEAMGETR